MIKIIKNKYFLYAVSVIISYFLTWGIFKFFDIQFPYNEIIFLLSMFCFIFLEQRLIKIINITEYKNIALSGVFSVLLSASFLFGRKIDLWNEPHFESFTYKDFIYLGLISLLIFVAVINLIDFVCSESVNIGSIKISKKLWLAAFILIMICWLPYLFVYYPGNLSSDSFSSVNQSIGITELYNHCPIGFTLFVKLFIKIGLLFGGLNFAVACFSFAQMLVLSGILSYFIYWLNKRGVSKYITLLTAMYFAFNPVIAMYSITMWKDVMFSGWILLFVLLIYEIVESNGELLKSFKGLAAVTACGILVSFSRNNGFYIVFATLFVISVCYRKYYKKYLPAFISVALAVCVIQGPVYNFLGIDKSGFAESVGIPLQQIGYAVKYGNVTDEQKEFINQLIPIETIVKVYDPISPDFIKFNEKFDDEFLEENKAEFFKVWAQMLPSNFSGYVKAYLMQTIGYYNIGTTNWICQYGIINNETNLYNTNYIEKIFNINVKDNIEKTIDNFENNPVIRDLFSIAVAVWLTFFYCLIMLRKKRNKYILPVIPLIALWGTMMIAVPTFCEFRYMFSFHLALPFLIITLFLKNKEEPQVNREVLP